MQKAVGVGRGGRRGCSELSGILWVLGARRSERGTCSHIENRILICGLEGLLRLSVAPFSCVFSWEMVLLVTVEDYSRKDLSLKDFV